MLFIDLCESTPNSGQVLLRVFYIGKHITVAYLIAVRAYTKLLTIQKFIVTKRGFQTRKSSMLDNCLLCKRFQKNAGNFVGFSEMYNPKMCQSPLQFKSTLYLSCPDLHCLTLFKCTPFSAALFDYQLKLL